MLDPPAAPAAAGPHEDRRNAGWSFPHQCAPFVHHAVTNCWETIFSVDSGTFSSNEKAQQLMSFLMRSENGVDLAEGGKWGSQPPPLHILPNPGGP